MKRAWPVALLVFSVLLALAPRAPWTGDARLHVASARSLVRSATVDVAADPALADGGHTVVAGGRLVSTLGLGGVLWLVPAEWVAALLSPRDPARLIAVQLETATAAAAMALLGALFFLRLRRLALPRSAALAMTLVLTLATPLLFHGRAPDGVALATLLLFVAVEQTRRLISDGARVRDGVLLGLAAGGLVLVEPNLLLASVALVGLAAAAVLRRGRAPEPVGHGKTSRAAATAAASLWLVAVAGVALERRFIGYAGEQPGSVVTGLFGLLLSTGKGLLLYSPPVILAGCALPWWWRTRRRDAELLLLVGGAVLLAAARLHDWHGDATWGPRRLAPLLPLLLEPVGPWLREQRPLRWPARAAIVAVLASGVGVQLVGTAIDVGVYLHVAEEAKNKSGASGWFGESVDQCHFIPQFSPIVGHTWLLRHVIERDRALTVDAPFTMLLTTRPKLDDQWPLVRLNWWALDWRTAAAAAWLVVLVASALASALVLRRRALEGP